MGHHNALLHIVSQQRQCSEDLSYLGLHEEEEEQHSTGRVGVVISGCPGHPRLVISESLLEVLRNGAMILLTKFAILSVEFCPSVITAVHKATQESKQLFPRNFKVFPDK